MLSESLQVELVAHINGSTLHETKTFKNFDIMFLAQITYCLEKETFTVNEYIFTEESTDVSKMYFIDKGLVVLLHKKTRTQIHELTTHDSFGEIGFFA